MIQTSRTFGFVRRLNASPNRTLLLVVCCLLTALLYPAAARTQSIFVWEGDNNNNWKNSANWFQIPGAGDVPDGSLDEVQFSATANRFNVDVNGAVRTLLPQHS